MSKARFLFILTLFIVGLSAVPSWADTDYPCLDTCIKSGRAAAACLPQCSQDQIKGHQQQKPSQTDYRCLNLCVNGGKPAAACLSQCTYNQSGTKSAANKAATGSLGMQSPPNMAEGAWGASHDVLHAPVPAGDMILVAPSKSLQPSADKNYGCLQQCLHDGMQYEMCDQNCSAVTPEFKAN
jgi:hypothetical protein